MPRREVLRQEPGKPFVDLKGTPLRIAVVVGIGYEGSSFPELRNAPGDAAAVAELLRSEYGFDAERQGRLLLDEAATADAIRSAMGDSLAQIPPSRNTQWLFYFAGHGYGTGDQGYLVPADAVDRSGYLPLRELLEACLDSACSETLIVIDACYAGQAMVLQPSFSDWLQRGVRSNDNVRQLIAAGHPEQSVWDDGGEGHSVFTHTLLGALEGWAGIHENHAINFSDLLRYLKKETAKRLRDQGRDPAEQRVLGGNLRGSRKGDFLFRATVPRIPASVVSGTRDDNAEKRLGSFRELVDCGRRHSRCLTLAVRLATQGLPEGKIDEAPPDKDAAFAEEDPRVRRQIAETLGALAGTGEPTFRELAIEDPLLHLAVGDDSPSVRYQARRSLRGLPGQPALVNRLLAFRKRASPHHRKATWQLIVTLPEGIRRLSPAARLCALVTRASLGAGRIWRWVVEHEARRKVAKWLATTLTLAPILFYVGVAANYYLSTSGRNVVVRRGLPGLEILPGIGDVAIDTGFIVNQLEDAGPATREELSGLWLPLDRGMLGWGRQLAELLRPDQSGLAYWRWGDRDEALRQLERGLAAAGETSVNALTYLAVHDGQATEAAIELLTAALREQPTLTETLLNALSRLRDAGPETVAPALRSLGERLGASDGIDAVALVEAVSVLGIDSPKALAGALAKGLELLEGGRPDQDFEARVGRALERIRSAQPQLTASVVPRLVAALERASPPNQAIFVSLLDLPSAADPQARHSAFTALFRHAQDPSRRGRASAIRVLARSLRPDESRGLAAVLASLLDDPVLDVRLAAAGALAEVPAAQAWRSVAVKRLRETIFSGEDGEVRAEAVATLERLSDAETATLIRQTLIRAGGDVSVRVRLNALGALARLTLSGLADVDRVEPVLRTALEDLSPAVKQEAGRALLLLADRLRGDLGPALEVVVPELASEDHDLGVSQAFGRELGTVNPAAARLVAPRVVPYIRGTHSSRHYLLSEFLRSLATSSPEVLPAVVPAVADLLAVPEADTQAELFFLSLDATMDIEGVLEVLLLRVHSTSPVDRQTAAEALVLLAPKHRELAARAAGALIALVADPEPEVAVKVAEYLGWIGSIPETTQKILPALLRGLGSSEPSLRAACGKALAELAEGKTPPATTLPQEIVETLDDPDPKVRHAAAEALSSWARHRPRGLDLAVARLEQRLAIETDPAARLGIAGALAAAAGDDPAVADRVIRLARQRLEDRDQQHERGALAIVQDLGENHSAQARRAVELLGAYLPEAREPFQFLLAVREVGMRQPAGGRAALAVMATALRHEEHFIRWSAIANGIESLVLTHPVLAREALRILDDVEADADVVTDRGMAYAIARAQTAVGKILAEEDPGMIWPLLSSSRTGERRRGRELLLHLVTKHPELEPEIRRELDKQRKSRRPHVRRSAALASEMLTDPESAQKEGSF